MAEKPNLLFIQSDQHAAFVTGCYGDPVVHTPNLDKLAARGTVFDNAYCPSPICVPSRMSTLTGRYPVENSVWTNDDMLNSQFPTMAHSLGAAGYRPLLRGRMHSVGPDQLRGYAERVVGDIGSNWESIRNLALGVLQNAQAPGLVSIEKSGQGQCGYQLHDEAVAAAACEQLRAFAQTRGNDGKKGSDGAEPFAMTVGFVLPHCPYVATKEDYQRYAGKIGMPRLGRPDPANEHPWQAWWRTESGIDNPPEDAVIRARTAYYGLVTRTDLLIGTILDTLEESGLAENTIVVYTSDHGEQIGERGHWWKNTFYDESVKVPLIVSWPAGLKGGQRRAQVVNLTDLTATLLELTGSPALPNASGRSFRDVLHDEGAPWVDETFSEYVTHAVPFWTWGMDVQQRMVRSGRWKLNYYHGYRAQLFDLQTDPDEMHDLAEDPAYGAVAQALLQKVLAGWDPEAIKHLLQRRRADKDLLRVWAGNIGPEEQFQFRISPEDSWLDPH